MSFWCLLLPLNCGRPTLAAAAAGAGADRSARLAMYLGVCLKGMLGPDTLGLCVGKMQQR